MAMGSHAFFSWFALLDHDTKLQALIFIVTLVVDLVNVNFFTYFQSSIQFATKISSLELLL